MKERKCKLRSPTYGQVSKVKTPQIENTTFTFFMTEFTYKSDYSVIWPISIARTSTLAFITFDIELETFISSVASCTFLYNETVVRLDVHMTVEAEQVGYFQLSQGLPSPPAHDNKVPSSCSHCDKNTRRYFVLQYLFSWEWRHEWRWMSGAASSRACACSQSPARDGCLLQA